MAVAELGYAIDSSGAVVAAKQLDEMNNAASRAEAGSKKLATAATASAARTAQFGKAMKVSSAHTANLGAQLNDIGVMLAAGQSPLQLAVQQGTQINQVFAQMGGGKQALRGLAAGFMSMVNPMSLATIGIIAGGAALVQWAVAASGAGEDGDILIDTVDGLIEAFDNYKKSVELASMSSKDMREEYGAASSVLRSTLDILNEIARSEAQSALDSAAESIANLMGVSGAGEDRSAVADFFDVNIWFAIGKEARELRSTARELTAEFVNSQSALTSAEGNVNAQRDALVRMLDVTIKLADADGKRSTEEEAIIKSIAEQLRIAEQMVITMDNATDATSRTADEANRLASSLLAAAQNAMAFQQSMASLSIPFSDAMDDLNFEITTKAMGAADKLVATRVRRLEETMRSASKKAFGFDYGLTSEQKTQLAEYQTAISGAAGDLTAKDPSKGGGASKKEDNKFGRDIDRLIESLRTEQETIDAWYDESQMLLADQRSMELLTAQEHNEAKLRLEQEYQERLSELRSGYDGNALQKAEAFMGGMATALANGNDKMQSAAEKFAAVEALINAYRAFNQVLADPTLPWYAKIPAAAGVLAAGMNAVSAIGGSSGGSSAPSAASTATSSQQRAIIQVEGGRSRFTVSEINDIIKGIQGEVDDGVIIEGFAT